MGYGFCLVWCSLGYAQNCSGSSGLLARFFWEAISCGDFEVYTSLLECGVFGGKGIFAVLRGVSKLSKLKNIFLKTLFDWVYALVCLSCENFFRFS